MIKNLILENFKCFKKLNLPLRDLTLLSGTNASGKSTVIQAFVLLHQTMCEHEWSTRLFLNGRSIELGAVSDVVDKIHGRKEFTMQVVDGDVVVNWQFSGERQDLSMSVDSVAVSGNGIKHKPKLLQYLLPAELDPSMFGLPIRLKRLTYITAERMGPRDFYSLEDGEVTTVVGRAGEHAASVLHCGRNDNVRDDLVLNNAPPTRLHQVEARMRQFFPGCSLSVEPVARVNAVTLSLRTSDDTDFHRPVNAGFGLTQVFPIVVAALSAQVDDILLIENPEVHLHPAGQAMMGRFLAEVANSGVQVILETHSDHVLNGIRRAVKAGMSRERVALHFFRPRGDGGAQVTSPQLDQSGNIDVWPDGFFDQFDKDMNHFAGWGE
jgi:predicted ATPase